MRRVYYYVVLKLVEKQHKYEVFEDRHYHGNRNAIIKRFGSRDEAEKYAESLKTKRTLAEREAYARVICDEQSNQLKSHQTIDDTDTSVSEESVSEEKQIVSKKWFDGAIYMLTKLTNDEVIALHDYQSYMKWLNDNYEVSSLKTYF